MAAWKSVLPTCSEHFPCLGQKAVTIKTLCQRFFSLAERVTGKVG